MKKIFTLLLLLIISLSPYLESQKVKDDEKTVYVLSLKGDVFDALARRFTKKLRKIDLKQTKAIIIEIDTPGGGVGYVSEICKEIDHIAQTGVPVYAYIVGKAWRGGALVSLACDRIYMKNEAVIGKAQLKIRTISGEKDAKSDSMVEIKKEFKKYAEQRNYPVNLALAMVDPGMQVQEIRYRGDRFFKTNKELAKMRLSPDIDAAQIVEKGVVVEVGVLANYEAKRAKEFGLCRGIVETRDDLFERTGLSQHNIKTLKTTSEDKVANILSNHWVRLLLIALGVLGIAIELMTPGFGIPGILGITFFSLFFLGGYLAETAAVWEILLFIVGLALLAIEIFVIPGFGIVGILGIIVCFTSLLLSFQTFILPETEEQVNILTMNIFNITFSLGIDIFAIIILMRFLPKSAPLSRLSIATVQSTEEGYCVAIPGFEKLIGQEGIAATDLRPSGRIKIENESYDVVTQGDFITKGTSVKVEEVQGNRIIVNQISN